MLGVLPGRGESVLPRAGDRTSQDLQHLLAGLHVDRLARAHRTKGLTPDGTRAERDLAEIDHGQLLTGARDERDVADLLLQRGRALAGLREYERVALGQIRDR